jgi:hypothetical protein
MLPPLPLRAAVVAAALATLPAALRAQRMSDASADRAVTACDGLDAAMVTP